MNRPTPLRVVDNRADAEPDRLPPHNIQAEQVVLGAVMMAPRVLAEVRALLDGTEFFRPAHTRIWDAIGALADRDAPFDPLAVSVELGKALTKVGGAPYLFDLIRAVPSAANGAYYAQLVRDLAYRRHVVEAGTRLVELGHDPDEAANLRGKVTAELATVTAADTRGWPDPLPLSANPDLPEFPVWTFPHWLGEYVAGLAEQTQTPLDLAACMSLAVLAVAAGGKVTVRATTWTEPLCLFVLSVLPPGNRKSEVFRAMTAPIRMAEAELKQEIEPKITRRKKPQRSSASR